MKNLTRIFIISMLLVLAGVQTASAQLTILPQTSLSENDCNSLLANYEAKANQKLGAIDGRDIMGCAIKTGRISMSMIPFFIKYFADFLIALIGLITVLFIILGGYFYIYGGLTEQKEKGKKFITNALLGMVIALLSWVIVNIAISALTQ